MSILTYRYSARMTISISIGLPVAPVRHSLYECRGFPTLPPTRASVMLKAVHKRPDIARRSQDATAAHALIKGRARPFIFTFSFITLIIEGKLITKVLRNSCPSRERRSTFAAGTALNVLGMPRHRTGFILGVSVTHAGPATAHAARSFRRCWWAQTGHRSGCAHAEVFRKPGTTMFSRLVYDLLPAVASGKTPSRPILGARKFTIGPFTGEAGSLRRGGQGG